MKTIKQEIGSKNCVAVVAAMAFNTTVDEFEEFAGKPKVKGYSDLDFIKFALSKNYLCGFVFQLPKLDEYGLISNAISIRKRPAYVVVKSETDESKTHSVFWDGEKILDPNPTAADIRDITDFEILAWYPITKLYEH